MKVKITHPSGEYKAGLEYDLPEDEALELIEKEQAVEIKEPKRKAKKWQPEEHI